MKRITLVFLLFCSIVSNGQEISDTISMVKENTIKFYHHNKEVRFVDLSDILKSNPEALNYFQYAKVNRSASNILLGLGIISLGYGVLSGIANAAENQEPSEFLAGTVAGIAIGGVLIVIAIPLKSAYKENARKAIDLYNQGLTVTGYRSPDLKIGITQNGFGLVVKF